MAVEFQVEVPVAPPVTAASNPLLQAQRTVSLKFEDVAYKIKNKGKLPGDRTILHGISGVVHPGEMLAMLGPSGSGKTTLLTALGGRLGRSLSGSITYNNHPFSTSMKRNLGFVTQDDVLYPHLTVADTLFYTSLLRLPKTLTRAEKLAQTEAVMAQLGLTGCRDSIIGGPLLRGISGGERKRVSIGQEMLINPSLIFLDEPTSGLDSTTAQRIVRTLWELAKGGRTVVMTIHQPSSRLFYMFHKILLLSDGSPMFFGKGSEAIAYFERVGYAPSVAMNPSDFLLDLANGVGMDETHEAPAETKQELKKAYEDNIKPGLHDELREASKKMEEMEMVREDYAWPTSWWEQFRVLLERDLKERRHEAFSKLRIVQVLIVAFLCGFLWWRSQGNVLDQVGLLFFSTGFWGFFPLFQAIFTFPQERTLLAKERSSGMYRLSSYFASRMVGDLPMELILPTIFIIMIYWMSGLKPSPVNFFETLLVTLICVLVSSGLGLALGALVMNLKTATTLASVLMLAFMLVGGFYVQKVPPFISWIKYFSISYYTFKLSLASQFSPDERYVCGPDGATCVVKDMPSVALVGFGGEDVGIAVMLGMLVLYRLVAYFALTRVGKVKS